MAEFFRITRVRPNGSEHVVRDIPISSETTDRLERAQAMADARLRRDSGLHIRLYSSSDGQVTRDDCVWDSALNKQ